MQTLVSWITALREAVLASSPESPAALSMVHKRVIYPSLEPINGEGFLRFQGLQSYTRPGHGTECLSVLSWYQPATDNRGMESVNTAASVGALLALATDRAVEVPLEYPIRMEGQETLSFIPLDAAIDRRLHAQIQGVSEINELFKHRASQLCSLAEGDLLAIGPAIEMHYGATLLYRRDVSTAYAVTVGAIETLSRSYWREDLNWHDWDRASSWDKFVRDNDLKENQANALRTRLMTDKAIRLRRTFAEYSSQTLPDDFWSSPWKEWTWGYNGVTGEPTGGTWEESRLAELFPANRSALRNALLRSYDSRSGFVHSGRRDIQLDTETIRQAQRADGTQPLSFTFLRAILARLICHELDRRSTAFELPPIESRFARPDGAD